MIQAESLVDSSWLMKASGKFSHTGQCTGWVAPLFIYNKRLENGSLHHMFISHSQQFMSGEM